MLKTTTKKLHIYGNKENAFYTPDYDLIKWKAILVQGEEHWLQIKFFYF